MEGGHSADEANAPERLRSLPSRLLSQSGLSDRTGIYRSDLVATINELTARGLVVRAPDPADRRRNAITLTDEGRRHLKHLDALIADGEAEFLVPLSEVDRAELTRILKLIVGYHSRL